MESETVDEPQVQEYRSTQRAMAEVLKRELPIPREPTINEKAFAEDFDQRNVSDLTGQELLHAMQVFIGFQAYASWELAKADIERTVTKATYDFSLSMAIVKYAPETCKSRREKEDWAKMTRLVHDAERRFLEAETYYQLLKPLVAGYEEKARVCSRELTRRTAPGITNPRVFGTQT